MADYKVQDTSLVAIADAIREKAGLSGAMVFPEGFVEAVSGIAIGGGSVFVTEITPAKNVTNNDERVTIEHGLGVFPDYVLVCRYNYKWDEEPAIEVNSAYLGGVVKIKEDETYCYYNGAIAYISDPSASWANAYWGGSRLDKNYTFSLNNLSGVGSPVSHISRTDIKLCGCANNSTAFLQAAVTYKVVVGVFA